MFTIRCYKSGINVQITSDYRLEWGEHAFLSTIDYGVRYLLVEPTTIRALKSYRNGEFGWFLSNSIQTKGFLRVYTMVSGGIVEPFSSQQASILIRRSLRNADIDIYF
ncbi:hypothetical protein Tco_0038791 [Tanacetum coccineum]